MKWLMIIFLLTGFLSSAQGQFEDLRDGRIYPVTNLGEVVWMGDNLKLNLNNSYFYYLNGNEVYYHASHVQSDGLCPEGWRLPTVEDWQALDDQVNEIALRPAGWLENGHFSGYGIKYVYWTGTKDDSLNLRMVAVIEDQSNGIAFQPAIESISASCRCVKE